MVRCKFKCVSKIGNEDGFRVKMEPVYCGSKENDEFFKWTPYGQFEIGTINLNTSEQFCEGQEYYIDINQV